MSRTHWPSWRCSTATLPLTKPGRPRNPDLRRKQSRSTAHPWAASSNCFRASPARSATEETSNTTWRVGGSSTAAEISDRCPSRDSPRARPPQARPKEPHHRAEELHRVPPGAGSNAHQQGRPDERFESSACSPSEGNPREGLPDRGRREAVFRDRRLAIEQVRLEGHGPDRGRAMRSRCAGAAREMRHARDGNRSTRKWPGRS